MDQREWDYGARMSRDRRAADPWTTRTPESPDFADPEPKWSALTDTGSLQPSDEALDWQRRADAWAQQAEADPNQSVEPAGRWSEAAATGRPTFPADGVGWRTETAEWRATGARWRQTTEWRSTTGSHVWRSTTEAWTGGDNSYPPAAETPMSQPAISSTAWSDERAEQDADTRPSWQQFTEPATPSWQEPEPSAPETSTPSWQQPAPRPPAESSPSWQQLVDRDQQQQPSWNARPSWQRNAIEGSATWTDLTDSRTAPSGAPAEATWLRTEDSRDDGRHLVREDDRAAWRRGAAADSPAPIGRRRAPETGTPSGGTGWSATRSESDSWDADNWAGHTDTGSIQLPGTPAPSPWETGTGFGSRNVGRRGEGGGRRALPPTAYEGGGYEIPPAAPYEPAPRTPRRDDTAGARALPPGRYDETPRRRYADDEPGSGRYGSDQAAGGYGPGETTAPGRPAGGRYEPGDGYGYEQPADGRYEDATSGRYADPSTSGRYGAEAAPTGYAAGSPGGRRRGHRYADETPGSDADQGYPRRGAASPTSGLAAGATGYPTETRSGRRRAERATDDTATFGSVPTGYEEQAPAAPQTPAPSGSAPGGRPKYRAGNGDWRDQTGSWESEPDTSSWVRDPDTGQWSRSEDDPRILAWRREAARREAMGEAPRALPPAPSESWQRDADEPGTGGRRNPAQPQLPPGPAPRSATPYGGGRADDGPDRYDGPGSAPRSAMPYGSASAPPYGGGAMPSAPRSAPGYGEATAPRYDEPTTAHRAPGYEDRTDPPTGRRAARYDEPAAPYGAYGEPAAPGYYEPAAPRRGSGYSGSAAPRSAPGYSGPTPGSGPSGQVGYAGYSGAGPASAPGYSGAAPAGGPSGGTGYSGAAPVSGPAGRAGYPATPGYSDSAPARGTDYPVTPTGGPTGGAGYPPRPTSGPADSAGYPARPTSGPAAPTGYSPANDYTSGGSAAAPTSGYSAAAPTSGYSATAPTTGRSAPAPRSAPGAAPATGAPYSGSAPASANPYSGSAPASASPYSGSAPAGGVPRYSSSAPASGVPRYSGAAPASGIPQQDSGQYTSASADGTYRSGRRRAEDDEPPTRRGALDPTAYAEQPLAPDAWTSNPATRPDGMRGADEAPPWSPGESTQGRARTETGTWHLAERQERARGSAVYREGGVADWRRDLADQSNLAEGESRRYGTSDFVPFRSGGAAAAPDTSNPSAAATSLIAPVAREQREAVAYPSRAGGQGLTGSYERRPVTGAYPTVRRSDLLDPDDEEDDQESGGPLAAVGYTVGWYGVPVILFVFYMLVLNSGAQTHALDTLGKAAPQFGISLVLSVVVAVGLRWVSRAWKAISVGLAAAVVGGGLATVLTSAITGNSLS